MFYLNKNRNFIINSEIVEWDIRAANLSLIKTYQLLPENIIDKIEPMKKADREIAVGLEMRKDKEFSKSLEKHFNIIIDEFLKVNNLDKDYDVISIKRDAAFVINRKINQSKFGDFIDFIPKHKYHAYIYLKPYEIYFEDNDNIEIKGLNNDVLSIHKDGMISLISDIIEIAETTNMNAKKLNHYLSEFVDAYKNRQLEYAMYREFTNESKFRYNMMGNIMMLDDIDETVLNRIDISYNYLNFILPLIQLIC